MRKLINLIALLIMASSVTWAQDKKSFTLEDLMPGGNNYYNLLPQNLYGLQNIVFMENNSLLCGE